MSHHNSDFEILPDLAKSSQALRKLEEYVGYIIETTQNWQKNRCLVKNEIREIFSALSSMLHQREMQLYEQVDEFDLLVNSINHSNAALTKDLATGTVSDSRKSCLKHTDLQKMLLSGSDISPQLKLRFQANVESLEEAIRSFGCVGIQDDNNSEESNFVFVNSAEDDLNMKVEHLSLYRNDLDQNDILHKTEVSSVGSPNSSDSFEVLSENSTFIPWLRKSNNNDTEFTSAGHSYPHLAIEKKDVGSLGLLSHAASPDKITDDSQWLRKPNVSAPELSPASVLAKSLASVLSSDYSSRAKGRQASSVDPVSNGSNLSSHLECRNASLNSESNSAAGVANTANGKIQTHAVSVASSGAVPKFSSIISKMLGNGNDGWLNSGNSSVINPPLSNSHGNTEATTEAGWKPQRSHPRLNRTVYHKEGPSLLHFGCSEESLCPYITLRKTFNPYFKTQDKNKWLLKTHTHHKKSHS